MSPSSYKTRLGLYLRQDVKDAYDAACRGNISEGFLVAPIIWIGLPADIREQAMTNGKPVTPGKAVAVIPKALIRGMSDSEIEQAVWMEESPDKQMFCHRENVTNRFAPYVLYRYTMVA